MLVLTVLVGAFAGPARAQEGVNHTPVVADVKQALVDKHVDLASPNDTQPCHVFQITARVAWILRSEGIGYVKKGGNNCRGYSVDALMYKDTGTVIDTLVGSGEANTPAWNVVGTRPLSDWAAPIDPGDVVDPPGPTPTPIDLTPLLRRLDALEHRATDTDARVQAATQAAADAAAQVAAFDGRIRVLEGRATVTGCAAALNLGAGKIPIACRLTF
jgi:hypothetical protein